MLPTHLGPDGGTGRRAPQLVPMVPLAPRAELGELPVSDMSNGTIATETLRSPLVAPLEPRARTEGVDADTVKVLWIRIGGNPDCILLCRPLRIGVVGMTLGHAWSDSRHPPPDALHPTRPLAAMTKMSCNR